MNGYTNESVGNNYEFSMNEGVACKGGCFYCLIYITINMYEMLFSIL